MQRREMDRMVLTVIAILLAGVLSGAWWLTHSPTPLPQPPEHDALPNLAEMTRASAPPSWLAVGTEIYRTDCLGCHRPDPQGPLVTDELARTVRALLRAENGPEYLVRLMLFGAGGNPPGAAKTFRHPPYHARRSDAELSAVLNLCVGLEDHPPHLFDPAQIAAQREPTWTREEVLTLRPRVEE